MSVLVVASCGKGGEKAPAGATAEATLPQAVRVRRVRALKLTERLDYVGTLRSRHEVRVSARVMGTLVTLPFREGAAVRKGQVLARIATPELGIRQTRLAADLQRLRNDRDFLCRNLARDRKLHASGVLPQARLDASRRRCLGAKQAVKAAQAAAAELRATRGKAVERAPFDGHVLRWIAQPGEHLAPGRPILLFGDDEFEVVVKVSESDLARGLTPGTAVVLTTRGLAAPSTRAELTSVTQQVERHAAMVRFVAPLATGPSRTVEVRIALPKALRGRARQGISVDVAFVLAQVDKANAVPEEAILSDGKSTTVFVLDHEKVRARRVKAGISARGWVAIAPPLPADARVAVSNLDVLRDGMTVYPVEVSGAGR